MCNVNANTKRNRSRKERLNIYWWTLYTKKLQTVNCLQIKFFKDQNNWDRYEKWSAE